MVYKIEKHQRGKIIINHEEKGWLRMEKINIDLLQTQKLKHLG